MSIDTEPLRHLDVVVKAGSPARCPVCGMWVEPSGHSLESYRQVLCWCDNWLDITYVRYVIEELWWHG